MTLSLPDVAQGITVEIQPGLETEATLVCPHPIRMPVTVKLPDGNPPRGAPPVSWTLVSDDTSVFPWSGRARTGTEGLYILTPPGSVQVLATQGLTRFGIAEVVASEGQRIEITLGEAR